ncbi:MAG TPA: hypothetical protein VGL19_23875 [Polyangiaceae bacterium]|jgi:hypothetical protein
MLPTDCLHSLTVDFENAPDALRAAFDFGHDELSDLLCLAGRDGLPLVLLCTESALHMVSTSQNHVRAFRPVLARIHERARSAEGWRALPVRGASGSDAARYLLRQAVPATRFEPEVRAFVRGLRAAAELSRACGAFSSELAALIRMTEHAAERVWQETRLGRPGSSEAELELESLVAERILEEELVGWQSSYPALRSSRRPISSPDILPFEGEERQSMVRLRAASVLTKLRVG